MQFITKQKFHLPKVLTKFSLISFTLYSFSIVNIYASGAIYNPAIDPILGRGDNGQDIIGRLLARFFAAALGLGAVAFLLYLVYGAFRWLTAGDDKAQLQSARNSMAQALIGLTLLASIFAIAKIVGIVLGIPNFPDTIIWPQV